MARAVCGDMVLTRRLGVLADARFHGFTATVAGMTARAAVPDGWVASLDYVVAQELVPALTP